MKLRLDALPLGRATKNWSLDSLTLSSTEVFSKSSETLCQQGKIETSSRLDASKRHLSAHRRDGNRYADPT